MSTLSDVERIRRRYPRSRLSGRAGVTALVVLAVFGLGWLAWTASFQAIPEVSARVDRYDIGEDATVVTVSVQRQDPEAEVSCLLVVQAANFERVGEVDVVVGPGGERQEQLEIEVGTFRQGVAASFDGCQVV